jgi:hypothetical protein
LACAAPPTFEGVFDTVTLERDYVGMATQTIVQVTDDLDSSPNAEAVTFGLGSDTWTIDLSKKNRNALEKLLRPYIDAARKIDGRAGGSGRKSTRATGRRPDRAAELAAIRDWARANGYAVSDRGRIAAPIVDAYKAAR